MPDMCRLDDNKPCTDCGNCDVCDLDASKVCDNCMKCLNTEQKFRSVVMVSPPAPSWTPGGNASIRPKKPRKNK